MGEKCVTRRNLMIVHVWSCSILALHDLKGLCQLLFSNVLKSQKSRFHLWKPENIGPVLLKGAMLRHETKGAFF